MIGGGSRVVKGQEEGTRPSSQKEILLHIADRDIVQNLKAQCIILGPNN